MDEKVAFMELSALLTGLYNIINDPEDKKLFERIADEYKRRLLAVFPLELTKLLKVYKDLASANPKPAIDDALLSTLRNTQEFKDKDTEFVAQQIVNIWYFSQFKDSRDKTAHFLDGGFYEHGRVWPIIKTHPIGFSNQPSGYWTKEPNYKT